MEEAPDKSAGGFPSRLRAYSVSSQAQFSGCLPLHEGQVQRDSPGRRWGRAPAASPPTTPRMQSIRPRVQRRRRSCMFVFLCAAYQLLHTHSSQRCRSFGTMTPFMDMTTPMTVTTQYLVQTKTRVQRGRVCAIDEQAVRGARKVRRTDEQGICTDRDTAESTPAGDYIRRAWRR